MKSKFTTGWLILLAVLCLGVAAWLGGQSRKGGAASGSSMDAPDIPPGVRFVSVALGGFRGLLADILWVRAAELQDDGNFFEVAQLADWITRLEPRYPEVWAYHAWNMAYNITALVPDPADRWHWVKNGLCLLRDEGLPANPTSPKLYWELGWMFYDKVGGRWDEATLFYRVNWALDMSRGGPHGLDPKVVKAVDHAYGPLDWRLPESQVIYWGYRGHFFQESGSRWCDRLVWMGMDQTLKEGLLAFSPERHIYQQGPRLDIAIKGIGQCTADHVFDDPLTRLVAMNFLRDATLYLYAFGKTNEASVAQQTLRNDPDSRKVAELPVEVFIQREVESQMKALDSVARREWIVKLLVHADVWRRLGDPLLAHGYERLARLHWEAVAKLESPAPAWETLQKEGSGRGRCELPETVRTPPQTP